MKLFWSSLAAQDRQKIREYIAQANPAAALALDARFSEQAEALTRHPDIGRTRRVSGTRELVVHPNYILVYDVVENSVRILRLLHAAKKWPLSDE